MGGGLLWSREAFPSSGKHKLLFVSGWQKATDYEKMLIDLSPAQEGCLLRGEMWISLWDNATIHNASIRKKYLLEQKIRFLEDASCSPNLNAIENVWGLIVVKVYEGGRQYSAISELERAILDA